SYNSFNILGYWEACPGNIHAILSESMVFPSLKNTPFLLRDFKPSFSIHSLKYFHLSFKSSNELNTIASLKLSFAQFKELFISTASSVDLFSFSIRCKNLEYLFFKSSVSAPENSTTSDIFSHLLKDVTFDVST